jgi:hypothetical protein
MKATSIFALVATSIVAAGCHAVAADLTRAQAKAALDKLGAATPITQITLSIEHLAKVGQAKDAKTLISRVFVEGKSVGCLPDPSDVRIATGQFVQCTPIDAGVTWQNPGVIVPLKQPIKWAIVEITGIASGQNPTDKVAEYTWQYDFSSFSLPKEFDEILTIPLRSGKALFRLYDDGWRFVEYVP